MRMKAYLHVIKPRVLLDDSADKSDGEDTCGII